MKRLKRAGRVKKDGGIDRREMEGGKRDSDSKGRGKNRNKRDRGNRVKVWH